MAKSIKRNYIYNLIYQLLVIIIPIITLPYLSRVLLEDGTGIYSYCESIAQYFVLFAVLGSAIFAQREIGTVQTEPEARSRAFWEIMIIRAVTTVIALAAYGVYLVFVKDNFVVSLILILNIVNVLFDITWFFQGIEEFGKTVLFSIVCKLLNFAFIFLFIKQQSDLWLYALGKCGFIVLGNIGMWFLLPKYLCKVRDIKPLRHMKGILLLFIPTVATQVYLVLDKSMIGWFADGPAENGYYDYAEKIVRMSITVISSLGTVLLPRISGAHAAGDYDAIRQHLYGAISYVWMIGIPLVFGFLAVADIFVPVYLGENFIKSALLIKVLSPVVLFVGMASIVGVAFLIPINKQNVYTISVSVAAAVNLVLNLILIPRYFSVGAAIASVVAEGIGVVIQLCYIFKKGYLKPKKVFLSSVKYFIAGAAMFAVLFCMQYFIPFEQNALSLAILILTGVVVYFALLLLMRDKVLLDFMGKIFRRIFKNKL